MSGVTPPSEGGYQYYKGTIKELEEDFDREKKRLQDRADNRVNNLDKDYEAALAKRDRDLAETIKDIKAASADQVAREREMAKNDVERVKTQTYDKWGRFNGLEADAMKRQFEDYKKAADQQDSKNRANLSDAEDAFRHRIEQDNLDHARQLEKVAQEARDSAQETYHAAYQGQANEYNKFKEDAEKNTNKILRENAEELNFQRRRAEAGINETQRTFQHEADVLKNTDDARFHKQQTALEEDEERHTRNLNESHENETRLLRDEIKDLVAAEGHYMKEKGQGTHDAITEYDNEVRARETRQREGYQREINKLKQEIHDLDSYFGHLNNQNLREKDTYFADLIGKQNMANHLEQKNLEQTFNHDRDQLVTRMQRDREQARESNENQLRDAAIQRDLALQNQAKAYENTIERQRDSSQQQIDLLQKHLQESTTSQDTSVISPAAEAAVRKSVVREYEKTLGAERDRNLAGTDSLQKEYARRLSDTTFAADARTTDIQRHNAAERNDERAQFLEHIQDTEFTTNLALRNKDIDHDRQNDNLTKNYALMLEHQRREYEEILNSAKNDANAKISAVRQESDFNSKMAMRAFSARQNELIRDYEKKLADQKNDYDAKMEDIKAQAQLALREGERKNRVALDEQSRGYEQRLAQQEYQFKERERYLTQSHSEELEKVKRSNALLIQKKS